MPKLLLIEGLIGPSKAGGILTFNVYRGAGGTCMTSGISERQVLPSFD